MLARFSVSLSISPQPLRAPVRWAAGPEEVPPWELGRSWSLFRPEYPEVLRKLGAPHGAGEAFQAALEEAERVLPPPPQGWAYPRLVLAKLPLLSFPGLWLEMIWHDLPKSMRPLTGFRRLLRALREDFRLEDWALPRTRKLLLEVVPRIGLLDPFRLEKLRLGDRLEEAGQVEEEGLLPHLEPSEGALEKGSPRYLKAELAGVGLGEDLWTWVRAILAVGFWDWAAEKARERARFEDFASSLSEVFGLEEERWGKLWKNFDRPLLSPLLQDEKVVYCVMPISPEEVLRREVYHLLRKGIAGRVLSPRLIRKRLWEWGLKGLVIPGPFRLAAAPQEGVKVAPLPALASSFHLALLEIAETLGEGRALVCEWCGATFMAQRPGRARYCSDACRLQAHRSRKGRLQISLPKAD